MIELFTALVMLVVVAGAVVAVGVGNVLHAIFGLAVSLLGIAASSSCCTARSSPRRRSSSTWAASRWR